MYGTPQKPCKESSELPVSDFGDCMSFTDGCHGAFIEVGEGRSIGFFARDFVSDDFCYMASGLKGALSDAGDWLAIAGGFCCSDITDGKSFGVTGNAKIRLDDYSTGVIKWHSERFCEWVSGDTCGPDNISNWYELLLDFNSVLIDLSYFRV